MDVLLRASALVAGYHAPLAGPLDLELARGQVVGLTGPNGVGKSTLLAALGGRARHYAGTLWCAPGLRIASQRQRPPSAAGLPLSGRELLALAGAPAAGLPSALAARLDARVDRLSGGQRQFLYLWASLKAPADVVLLDEPTNNLDPGGQAALVDELRARCQAIGVLLVSHDADFLAAACQRVIRLEAPWTA